METLNNEKELYKTLLAFFYANGIDFLHLKNSSFSKRAARNYYSPVTGVPCDKHWPDFTFCFRGRVYMIEFGIKGRHKEQKEKQQARMVHWGVAGGVFTAKIETAAELKLFLENLRRSWS
jgi:hypothetical protein